MLTFLELYQTLLGFVLFKLYTDSSLVYPPPLDMKKYDGGAGVGAFSLQETVKPGDSLPAKVKIVDVEGRKVTTKDVRQTIKDIASNDASSQDVEMAQPESAVEAEDEDFVPRTSATTEAASLPTLKTLESLPASISTTLFSSCTFFLSRETSRPIFEFLVRSFGGRIGWEDSSGSGSPYTSNDDAITHVIIDRPLVEPTDESEDDRRRRLSRKYVQPQWVVDCINAGKIILEDDYAQGKSLPPHLSPFGEYYEGAYNPATAADDAMDEDVSDEEEDGLEKDSNVEMAIEAVANAAQEEDSSLRAAELAAEVAGVDPATFEKQVNKVSKQKKSDNLVDVAEEDMNKMMMSKRQKKLYEKVKHSQQKRVAEVCFCPGVMIMTLSFSTENKPRGEEKDDTKAEEERG